MVGWGSTGGRPPVDDNEHFQKLRDVKIRKNVKLDKLRDLYERQIRLAKIEWENELANAIVDAKDNGLSNYAIGKATGVTGNDKNKEQIVWAFQRIKQNAENAEWGEQIGE